MISPAAQVPPATPLTQMGVTPTNALSKYNVSVSEHNSISLDAPQVRQTTALEVRGSSVNIQA